jgi:hypothetical protein
VVVRFSGSPCDGAHHVERRHRSGQGQRMFLLNAESLRTTAEVVRFNCDVAAFHTFALGLFLDGYTYARLRADICDDR